MGNKDANMIRTRFGVYRNPPATCRLSIGVTNRGLRERYESPRPSHEIVPQHLLERTWRRP